MTTLATEPQERTRQIFEVYVRDWTTVPQPALLAGYDDEDDPEPHIFRGID